MSRAMLAELRRIRVAVRAQSAIAVDYATAAEMLCTSKRSIERMVAEDRLRPIDLAGPKIPVKQLRALVDGRARATRRPAPRRKEGPGLLERVKAMAAAAAEPGEAPHE